MSRSIHTTYTKNIRGLTKKELEEQSIDSSSDLAALAKKRSIKKKVKKSRRQNKNKKKSTMRVQRNNISFAIT